MSNLADRLWSRVDKNGPVPECRPDLGPCWLWTGTKSPQGYGRLVAEAGTKRLAAAHRVAYELTVGAIPDGLPLDHLCRVHACVRPSHLEPVTNRENVLRGESPNVVIARSGACGRGHPFTEESTYLRPDGRKCCRICKRLSNQRMRERGTDARAAKRRTTRAQSEAA